MRKRPSAAGDALTALILELFRFNGRLLAAGDRLVEPLGLSSARWQVLGAIALAPSPEPVAHIARRMGLNRQGVQRIVDEMTREGWFAFAPNPQHRRAKLVMLTESGRALYADAEALQIPWADALARGLAQERLTDAARLLHELRTRLETDTEPANG